MASAGNGGGAGAGGRSVGTNTAAGSGGVTGGAHTVAGGVARNAEGVRWDHLFIVDQVPQGSRVLDLGCGRGTLLKMLVDRKGVRGTGIEIVEEKVYDAVTKGLTVFHGDFNEGLSYYPDNSFDYVILSQTLQEARETVATLFEALRVGRYVVASFPNFGQWHSRFQLLVNGRAPVTKSLPYQWYDTPNVHSLTIKDFRRFSREQGIRIVQEFFVGEKGPLRAWPNLRASYGVFVLESVLGRGEGRAAPQDASAAPSGAAGAKDSAAPRATDTVE
ncbi:MAG: methionine biosynthesis protein MetW [Actinobacteria bacterium]|nr:methionine biosynthesis protein MetW [Actinomycetota bacterium]